MLNVARNDHKSAGGESFILTEELLELVGVDLMFVDQERPILAYVDYYTRLGRAVVLKSKEAEEIAKALEMIEKELGTVKIITTDNGKEFCRI